MNNQSVSNQYVYDLDRQYVFQSWATQGTLNPLVIAGGHGRTLWDYSGKEHLDFTSQLINTNIGHQHPKVIAAIKKQADQLTTISPSTANLARGEAAKRIVDCAPLNFRKVFFTNGGADANENAMRMARVYTGRDKILSAYRSYHGNTGGAIAASGDPRRFPNEYARGHVHFFNPYLYRSAFKATSEVQECECALHHLRLVIEREGPSTIAAILLEPIPGSPGILVPPAGCLEGVRQLADEYGLLLIFDEVMVGFGRTGKWFGQYHFSAVPDLITFAKGVNSGYVPVGGVLVSEKLSEFFDNHYFPGGLTYSGHPLAMASIAANIDAMREEEVVENASRIGSEILGPGLQELANKHEIIGEVRGRGVLWAIEFVEDRRTKKPIDQHVLSMIKSRAQEHGLLLATFDNRINVAPPCTVTAEETRLALSKMDRVFSEVARQT